MKGLLFVLFGVIAAATAVGLVFAFTRPLKWSGNVRNLDWRRVMGEVVEDAAGEEAAA